MKKPNIIFILTDDQGPWALGSAGTKELKTPTLDKMAKEGIRFTDFYCTSPVCSPARASLLTGMIPSQHGVLDWIKSGNVKNDRKQKELDISDESEPIEFLKGIKSYTDYLAENGYICGLSGKWHLGDSIKPQKSFSYWYTHVRGGGSYYNAPMIEDGAIYNEPKYLTDAITDRALNFIDDNEKNLFYLSVHYTAPHSPWIDNHPKDLVNYYMESDFPSMPRTPVAKDSIFNLKPETKKWRMSLAGYFASITAVDMNIKRLFDKLEEKGLDDNTLVIFTSDNGYNCGHHGIWGKGNGTYPLNMFETSVKVPFIAWHKGEIEPGICSQNLSGYDFMPTLLEYIGIKYNNPNLPGRSFFKLLKGDETEFSNDIVIYDEYGPVRMIRYGRYKYIHRYYDGPHELYDLIDDPDEELNLIDDKSKANIIEDLKGRLKAWFIRYVDPEKDALHEDVTGSGQSDLAGIKGKNAYDKPYEIHSISG